jgi:hypothetical protein
MKVLFSTGSSASYMMPPQLGDEQVVCGPDWKDETGADGKVRSLATPAGRYDLYAVAERLPEEQKPDLVVCLVDASWRNLPQNLAAFKCPRVLLVADTHHMDAPILGMLRYLSSQPYDRVVLLYDRHHATIFRSAGVKNLFWLPGLTFPHDDAFVASCRRGAANRVPRIAFSGQVGKFHPYRRALVGELELRKLIDVHPLPQRQGMALYGGALAGFNASLNGDLNLRVFEILSAGAVLLTDELAEESGLRRLEEEGCPLCTYRSPGDLVERAQALLADPSGSAAAGAKGAKWFDSHLSAPRRRELFARVAFDGAAAPWLEFSPQEKTRVYFGGDSSRLPAALAVYQRLQERHRVSLEVRVMAGAGVPASVSELFTTLPRVRILPLAADARVEMAVIGEGDRPPLGAEELWCCPLDANRTQSLAARLREARYGVLDAAAGLFSRPAEAPQVEEQRRNLAALAQIQEVLNASPTCVDAALLLAHVAARMGANEVFAKALAMAGMLAPQDPRAALLARNRLVLPAVTDVRVLRVALSLARTPEALHPLLPILAEALPFLSAKEGLPLETLFLIASAAERTGDRGLLGAVARLAYGKAPEELRSLLLAAKTNIVTDVGVLRAARKRHPDSVPLCMQIALTLRKSGRLLEGLDLQRRMCGCQTPIPAVDPAKRRVRVGFLMQHPQGWTGFESVWRSMRDDPAFEAVVYAAPYDHPYAPEGGRDAVYPFLEKEGVPYVRWDAKPMTEDFADVLFVQNPYDITRPEPLRTPNLLRHVARLAYIPYGLEIGGGGENAANQFNQILQQTAWAWFARSPRHRDMIARHCDAGGAHVVVTGHPRMDMYRNLRELSPDPEFAAFAKGRKLVFWNPQFDIRPNNTGYSTFLIWQEFFLEEFAKRQDVAFVIRPHPLFFGTLESRKIWTRAQVDDFLRRVEKAGNVLIDRRSSYLPVFAASDAMLSDASSFLLEYGATGRPLLYLHNPDGPSLNDDGEFVRAHNYTALSREDVSSFITMVAEGRDPLGEGRRGSYGEVMTCPPGGVAQKIKTHILTQLAQEARQLCR